MKNSIKFCALFSGCFYTKQHHFTFCLLAKHKVIYTRISTLMQYILQCSSRSLHLDYNRILSRYWYLCINPIKLCCLKSQLSIYFFLMNNVLSVYNVINFLTWILFDLDFDLSLNWANIICHRENIELFICSFMCKPLLNCKAYKNNLNASY